MFNIARAIKPWRETAELNDHISLYGFWNETVFVTKAGDVGMVLKVEGVDYESLDQSEQEYAVKRLEAAMKAFGPGVRVYQYLFKTNRPHIPFAHYDDAVVDAAIDQRRTFFEGKRDELFQVEIFYVILFEGQRAKRGIGAGLAMLVRDPAAGVNELKSQFSSNSMKSLMRSQVANSVARLEQRVQVFVRQLQDFVQIAALGHALPRCRRVDRCYCGLSRECIEHPQGGSQHLQSGHGGHRTEGQGRVRDQSQGEEAAAARQGGNEGQESCLNPIEAASLRPHFTRAFRAAGRHRFGFSLHLFPAAGPRSPVARQESSSSSCTCPSSR
jgi:hypothetical protein